jgi:hypothetical protein
LAAASLFVLSVQIRFVLLLSRQGKVRLAKWYTTISQKERAKITKEVATVVLARPAKLCNFVDWKDQKIVYKRYASLYFIAGVDQGEAAAGQGSGLADGVVAGLGRPPETLLSQHTCHQLCATLAVRPPVLQKTTSC